MNEDMESIKVVINSPAIETLENRKNNQFVDKLNQLETEKVRDIFVKILRESSKYKNIVFGGIKIS